MAITGGGVGYEPTALGSTTRAAHDKCSVCQGSPKDTWAFDNNCLNRLSVSSTIESPVDSTRSQMPSVTHIFRRHPYLSQNRSDTCGIRTHAGRPNGLAGRRLNHSAKLSLRTFGRLRLVCVFASVAGGGCAVAWLGVPVVSGCCR